MPVIIFSILFKVSIKNSSFNNLLKILSKAAVTLSRAASQDSA
jgi:hypothetical protein